MPLIKALFCQILAGVCTLLIVRLLLNFTLPIVGVVIMQAIIAAGVSILIRQAIWWRIIHLVFIPAIFFMQYIQLPSSLYLWAFLCSILIFWGTVKGDVPLFLSSAKVVENVQHIVAGEQAHSFADIGAGVGSMIIPLAKKHPELRIFAVERAPLPWLFMLYRCRQLNNVKVVFTDFWRSDLSDYAVVYAFLSPLVMEKVGQKVENSMRHGSLFISCCFPIPDWSPEKTVFINDMRKTKLFCYRIKHY